MTAIATVGALVVDLVCYQAFLLLLGSVFVPLFAVLLADWLAAGRHYSPEAIFEAPAWRPGLIAAWIAGFALYQWLYPTGPAGRPTSSCASSRRTGGSGRRCRASSSRSRSQGSSRSSRAGP